MLSYRTITGVFILFLALGETGAKPFYKKRTVPRARVQQWTSPDYILKAYSRSFGQGDFVYFRLQFKPGSQPVGEPQLQADRPVVLTAGQAGEYDGLYGIATDAVPGEVNFTVRLRLKQQGAEKKAEYRHALMRYKTDFYEKRITTKLKVAGKYTAPSKKDIELIQSAAKLKAKAFSSRSKRMWTGRFIDARNLARVNSPFWGRRIYNGKAGSHHSGVDLKGRIGAPIRAMNTGRVVLAARLYYEGNLTILDHGEGLFTYYMHQSKILVKEGDMVKKGQLIGRVGNSGMVTGPHLHLSAKYYGKLMSPLSLLSLPVSP